jgi:hypothetical protein
MADAVLDPNDKKTRTSISDPYVAQGAGETIDSLKNRYAGLIQGSNFGGGFGGGGNSLLANRLSQLRSQKLSDQSTQTDLDMPLLYADRQKNFMDVSNAEKQVIDQEEQLRQQAIAAKKAKQRALTAGVLGLAGAGAGAMVGGPAGAQIGGGIGTLAGSQI